MHACATETVSSRSIRNLHCPTCCTGTSLRDGWRGGSSYMSLQPGPPMVVEVSAAHSGSDIGRCGYGRAALVPSTQAHQERGPPPTATMEPAGDARASGEGLQIWYGCRRERNSPTDRAIHVHTVVVWVQIGCGSGRLIYGRPSVAVRTVDFPTVLFSLFNKFLSFSGEKNSRKNFQETGKILVTKI